MPPVHGIAYQYPLLRIIAYYWLYMCCGLFLSLGPCVVFVPRTIYIYIYIYVYKYMYTYMYKYMYKYMYTYIYIYIYFKK